MMPNAKPVTVDGVKYPSIAAACRAHGTSHSSVWQRMKNHGVSFEKALSLVGAHSGRTELLIDDVVYGSISDAARQLGLPRDCLKHRLRKGDTGELLVRPLQKGYHTHGQTGQRWCSRAQVSMYNTRKRGAKCERHKKCQTVDAFLPIYKEAHEKGCHVDHVKPLAKGGKHCINNLVLKAPKINMRKGARDEDSEEFLAVLREEAERLGYKLVKRSNHTTTNKRKL